jgi:hypothetical protein
MIGDCHSSEWSSHNFALSSQSPLSHLTAASDRRKASISTEGGRNGVYDAWCVLVVAALSVLVSCCVVVSFSLERIRISSVSVSVSVLVTVSVN